MIEYLTIDELSRRIKYEPGSIRNLICSGKLVKNIHYVKPAHNKILFIWTAVEAWMYNPESRCVHKGSGTLPARKMLSKNQCLVNI